MDELIPIFVAAVLGSIVWRYASASSRPLLLILTVVFSGLTATIISGEYAISWAYLVPDIAEAAVGLTAGILIARGPTRASPSGLRKLYGDETTEGTR